MSAAVSTPIATRYCAPLALLLALAAVPVWLQRGPESVRDDCADPAALRDVLPLGPVRDVVEARGEYRSGVFQWTHGTALAGGGRERPLHFRIIRSRESQQSYASPYGLMGLVDLRGYRDEVRSFDASGETLPLHVGSVDGQAQILVFAYAWVYDGRLARSVFPAAVASGLRRLYGGPRPLTLLVAAGTGGPEDRAAIEASTQAWIASAWQRYRDVCLR